MQRPIMLVAICATAACSASTRSPAHERATASTPIATPPRTGHADIDLSGAWATGSAAEPEVKGITVWPQCNSSPGQWLIEQHGDTVRAWTIEASYAKGTATTETSSSAPADGWVSGVDLTIPSSGARYLLRYDSTSEHLRGTRNGAPFSAVRLDIVRPEGCMPVP